MDYATDFIAHFGQKPLVKATAPGRVNLLGGHTDYNDGFVLPIAIPQQTTVYIALSQDNQHHFYSRNLDEQIDLWPSASIPQNFSSYLMGCIRVLEKQPILVPPLRVYIHSDVPIGSGLASSAALEVAMLRGLRTLLQLAIDDISIAQWGQQSEREFVGVQCGIMDQMAASLADTDHLLWIDIRTLDYQRLPLPHDAEILILHSGIERTLANSGYNQRRADCEAAARWLGVKTLRDIKEIQSLHDLPNQLQKRARHVVTENNRVMTATQSISAQAFGELMNASHRSLRDDYQVSVPDLDALVKGLQSHPDVYGARLTGAGFGGACVALAKRGKAFDISKTVLKTYNQTGHQGYRLIP